MKNDRYTEIGDNVEDYTNTNSIGPQTAMAIAGLSDHKFRLGAVVVKNRRVLSASSNMNKTSGFYCKHFPISKIDKLHAEARAVLRARMNLNGAKIFIARRTASGFGLARPCIICWSILCEAGIKEVVYTTQNGWSREKI